MCLTSTTADVKQEGDGGLVNWGELMKSSSLRRLWDNVALELSPQRWLLWPARQGMTRTRGPKVFPGPEPFPPPRPALHPPSPTLSLPFPFSLLLPSINLSIFCETGEPNQDFCACSACFAPLTADYSPVLFLLLLLLLRHSFTKLPGLSLNSPVAQAWFKNCDLPASASWVAVIKGLCYQPKEISRHSSKFQNVPEGR